jgi:hypothetical protein
MGAGGEDVLLSPLARSYYPWSIECKANARIAACRFLEQAQSNCPKGAEPVVVMKENRRKPVVLVDAEYFFFLQSNLNNAEEDLEGFYEDMAGESI